MNINQLRDELQIKDHALQQLHNDRNKQQQNLKRAFMRGVSALNLEAMSLFDPRKTMSASGPPSATMKREEVGDVTDIHRDED